MQGFAKFAYRIVRNIGRRKHWQIEQGFYKIYANALTMFGWQIDERSLSPNSSMFSTANVLCYTVFSLLLTFSFKCTGKMIFYLTSILHYMHGAGHPIKIRNITLPCMHAYRFTTVMVRYQRQSMCSTLLVSTSLITLHHLHSTMCI